MSAAAAVVVPRFLPLPLPGRSPLPLPVLLPDGDEVDVITAVSGTCALDFNNYTIVV